MSHRIFLPWSKRGRSGYDLKLGFPGLPTYIQFKLSDRLTRRPAKYWDYYHEPYFRFDITPRTVSQTNTTFLRDLADNGEEVFLRSAAVLEHKTSFNEAFRDSQIAARSMWLPLGQLPYLTDYEPHHVTFTGPADASLAHRPVETWKAIEWKVSFSWRGRYESIVSRFERSELRQVSEEYLYELRNLLTEIVTRRAPERLERMGPPMSTVKHCGRD